MINLLNGNEKMKNVMRTFIGLNVLNYVVFQVLSILRASGIFNVTVLSVYFLLLTSLLITWHFFKNIRKVRLNTIEAGLIIIPVIYFFFGILVNGVNRDIFSDTYTSIFFIILFAFVRASDFEFESKFQINVANWMFLGLLISTFVYKLAPIIGIAVFSVGVTSIFFAFPLMVFIVNKMYFRGITHLLLLVVAGKRGILLSILVTFFIMMLRNKKIKKSIRFIVVLGIIVSFCTVALFTLTPERVSLFPTQVQPLIFKIMLINPFSEYNKIGSDSRVLEVKSALKPIIDEPIYLLTGKGAGYSYTVFDINGDFKKGDTHNSHFSPVGIYIKYGVFYLILFYSYVIYIIAKSYKYINIREISKEKLALLLYVTAGFINSFTAFTFYNDYLFILSLAILHKSLKDRSLALDRTKELYS